MNPLRWFLGDGTYFRITTTGKAWLYWFVGRPIDNGGKVAVAAGEVVIDQQLQVIRQLAQAVGNLQAVEKLCDKTLDENVSSIEDLRGRMPALMAEDETAAMEVALEIQSLEQMTPQFRTDLENAQIALEQGKEKLKQQQLLLKKMELQQKSNATQQRIAAAREAAQEQMDLVKLTGTRTLERATNAIQQRGLVAQGVSEATDSIGATDRTIANIEAASLLDQYRIKPSEDK